MLRAAARAARRRENQRSVSTLILLRHGQSKWNGADAIFSGWVDVPLTVKGRVEAVGAGQLLRERGFPAKRVDVAFTSNLQRAHETCELALASMAGAQQDTWHSDRIRRDARLNERHYGSLQGWRKADPELVQGFGSDMLLSWRRTMDAKPPPMTKEHHHYDPDAPRTETLRDCQKRVVACWETTIAPALFEEENLPTEIENRTILVAAHSNTLRMLMAYFDEVADEKVPELYVPNAVPIIYRFDPTSRKPLSRKLDTQSGGSHARWLLSPSNHAQVQEALQSGGMLTRALFESIDVERKGRLTAAEFDAGIKTLMADAEHVDCVVVGVAKKIARESVTPNCSVSLAEFEELAQAAVSELHAEEHIDYDAEHRWD